MKKMSERAKQVIGEIAIVATLLGLMVVCLGVKLYYDYQTEQQETFDKIDRNNAVAILSEQRGMIYEIKYLSHSGVSQNILLRELKRLSSLSYSSNSYLKEVVLFPPNTSNVEDICEELISQIDDYIRAIEYGAKGE